MKPSEALHSHREEIRRVVELNRARNPRVFGSVLYGVDTEQSDLDILVDTTDNTTLLDIARIQGKLQKMLGVSVDVLTPKALPDSFRDQVISEARPL